MVIRQEHVDRSGLMSDGPQKMTVQGVDCCRVRERNPTNPQLVGEPFIHDAGISPRVYEGGKGMGTLLEEKLDVKQGSLVWERLHGGMAHQYFPLYWGRGAGGRGDSLLTAMRLMTRRGLLLLLSLSPNPNIHSDGQPNQHVQRRQEIMRD
ncbi:Hypothetical protein SMAX5B_003374 [Scophthalmus maximus]|uniref:Uncharacterized protein n=1 Tax=Scophthalmus maximus TaxID=52904 RepID=A0A2U9CZ12_SCOMX|nr:Hypothetical protein SMAX5B_003374 [Scophthalmus maximus]